MSQIVNYECEFKFAVGERVIRKKCGSLLTVECLIPYPTQMKDTDGRIFVFLIPYYKVSSIDGWTHQSQLRKPSKKTLSMLAKEADQFQNEPYEEDAE